MMRSVTSKPGPKYAAAATSCAYDVNTVRLDPVLRPRRIHSQLQTGPLMRTTLLCATLLCAFSAFAQTTPQACSNITLGTNGALNGFAPSPGDAWHQDISGVAVDPLSATILSNTNDLGGSFLHPDFSSIAGGNYGIPYTVVDSATTPMAAVDVNLYPTESDLSVAPLTSSQAAEGGTVGCTSSSNDHHAILIDRSTCVVYEYWQANYCSSAWSASTSVVWDLLNTEKRPWGYTSVDAAGLSVFSGLLRYDEIVAGSVQHAIRFTALHSKTATHLGYFVAPATHAAGTNATTDNIMGMRLRLKANFDVSSYSTTNQIILNAMKKYGLILADNGSNMFFQGTTDARWNDDDLHKLTKIPSSAFDVVQMGTVYQGTTVPTGATPTITSFTASASTVPSGTAVTLTPTVTGASYSYIDKVGFVRGAVTVKPTATTTYLLTSRNAYGSTSSSVTVTVAEANATPTLAFASIGSKAYGTAAFAVSATSASSGAVTYSVTSGPATVAGSTVTLTGVGTVALKASQAAAGTYAATTATTSFAVTAGDPGLAFVAIASQSYGATPFTVSTTTKSGGSISYAVTSGPATISGNTVTLTGAGTVVLAASQVASGNYAADTASTSFTVTGSATKTVLTLPAIWGSNFSAGAFSIASTSNSPATITYAVTSGPATVSGSTVTPTGIGSVTVLVSQAATGTYTAASVSRVITINAATPTLTISPIASVAYGSTPVTVSVASNSTGALTYSANGAAATSSNMIAITSTGKVTVTVQQAAAGNYTAGSGSVSFTVTAATPNLVIGAIPTQTAGGSFTVTSTSNSTGAVTYAVASGPATVSGNTVTVTKAGTVTIRARQAAAGNYAGVDVYATFSVVAK